MLTTKHFATAFWVFILSLGLFTANFAAWAQSTATTIDVGDSATLSGTNWTYDSVNEMFTVTGDVTITGSTTTNGVTVAPGTTANITLDNASIDLENLSVMFTRGAFNIAGATVTLTIVGTNLLTSGVFFAGLQVQEDAALTINGTDADILTAIGESAGIGGGGASIPSTGVITINGGVINATGGAGIGSGYGSDEATGGVITINGGMVTATGGWGSAGIGGGSGNGGAVTIVGGTVDARGGQYGAGIGGGGLGGTTDGCTGGAGGTITITGGMVTATGGQYGAGIGGGGGGGAGGASALNNGGTGGIGGVIVIGGSAQVTAVGGDMAAGIGGGGGGGARSLSAGTGGKGGAGGAITISGGTVSATGNGLAAGIGGGWGESAGNGFGDPGTGGAGGDILIYGENTVVTAKGGASTSSSDIGAGGRASGLGAVGHVFVVLTPANLILSSPPAATRNDVLFTATPTSANTVTATLPAPFNAAPFGAGTIDVLTGLDPTGKSMSVITMFTTQGVSFALPGYRNSPMTKSGTALMRSGESVDFADALTIIDIAEISLTAPVVGATPDTTANGTGDFTVGSVSWSPPDATFQNGVSYTATVTLTPNSDYTFAGGLTVATINGRNATVTSNADGTATLSYPFMFRNLNASSIPTLNPAALALLVLALMMGTAFWLKRGRVRE